MIESYLSDDYWTLSGPGTAHTRVLGSRFSAIAFHVADESELESRLMELKKTEFDATHHCWAHVIRKDHELRERVSDDGEPKGTAGLPILHEIRKQNLQNIAVIVARWFGGTKLGTGGLVRAYGECGALAIGNAVRVQRKTGVIVAVDTPFELQSVVYQLAASSFAHVEQASSEGDARLLVKLRRAQAEAFCVALRDRSAGRLAGFIEGEWTS